MDDFGGWFRLFIFHPKNTVKQEQLEDFYNTLAGGGYNSKHSVWGSRPITPIEREVFETMEINNLKDPSTGEHTYLPDQEDYCVTEGIPQEFAAANHVLTYPPIILRSWSQ
jgi:hypothetical protein